MPVYCKSGDCCCLSALLLLVLVCMTRNQNPFVEPVHDQCCAAKLPCAGLDARAAAIVMKSVKAVASGGHTVMVTIHQPSINIFEAFDQLLLLQVCMQGVVLLQTEVCVCMCVNMCISACLPPVSVQTPAVPAQVVTSAV